MNFIVHSAVRSNMKSLYGTQNIAQYSMRIFERCNTFLTKQKNFGVTGLLI